MEPNRQLLAFLAALRTELHLTGYTTDEVDAFMLLALRAASKATD